LHLTYILQILEGFFSLSSLISSNEANLTSGCFSEGVNSPEIILDLKTIISKLFPFTVFGV